MAGKAATMSNGNGMSRRDALYCASSMAWSVGDYETYGVLDRMIAQADGQSPVTQEDALMAAIGLMRDAGMRSEAGALASILARRQGRKAMTRREAIANGASLLPPTHKGRAVLARMAEKV